MKESWIKKFGADAYNKHCEHLFQDEYGTYKCRIKMDMLFCGNKCGYATNIKGTLKVDKKGRVIGLNE